MMPVNLCFSLNTRRQRFRRSFVGCRGFSVIELMIVVLLMGMAITKAVPFTVDWVNSARVTETEASLIEAIGLAKAKSLRNASGVIEGRPVAAICYSNDRVAVVEAPDENSPADCSNAAMEVWRSSIAPNIDIGESGVDFSCLCMDAKAQITQLGACGSCSVASSFTLAAGGISENVEIY